MLYNETYRKYFDDNGLKNIFLPILEIGEAQVERWINKSIDEINCFSNYILLINNYEKEPIDNFTLTAIHESLVDSSISITFCMFNIFALITGTEASFFDDHIKDYYKCKAKLNNEEMNLLSFKWQNPIHSISSLSYSSDEKLCVNKCDGIIVFKIINTNIKELLNKIRKCKESRMISSKEFFLIHFLQILSTIDLIASLLSEKRVNSKLNGTLHNNSYIQIENINDFMVICEDILPELK